MSASRVLHAITDLADLEARGPLPIARGEGIYAIDGDGRRLIEGMAGAWCLALGYGREELVEAAAAQMRELAYNPTFYGRAAAPTVELAERLCEMAPFPAARAFFVNSGSEGNDTQVRLLWYLNNLRGRPRKKKVIAREGSYHGSGGISASLTGMAAFHDDFDGPADYVVRAPSPYHYRDARDGESEEEFSRRLADELDALIAREDPDTIAAFVIDPIQTSGGVIVPPPTYFAEIQRVLDRYDIRIVVDEVVTGFWRTGARFGSDAFGIRPDAITVAKQLSSAYLPIGAALVDAETYEALVEGSRRHGILGHGYTYGGHPVCAAVALRTLDLYEELDVPGHVERVGARFRARLDELAGHDLVGQAQSVGLVGAVELVAAKSPREPFSAAAGVGAFCRERCLEHRLIVRNVGDRICLAPPLVIEEDQVDELFDALAAALDDTAAWLRSPAGAGASPDA